MKTKTELKIIKSEPVELKMNNKNNDKTSEIYKTLFAINGGLKCSCGDDLEVHWCCKIPGEEDYLLLAATERKTKRSFVIFDVKKNKVLPEGTFSFLSPALTDFEYVEIEYSKDFSKVLSGINLVHIKEIIKESKNQKY